MGQGGGGSGPIRGWGGGGEGSKVWVRWVMLGMGNVNFFGGVRSGGGGGGGGGTSGWGSGWM